MKDVIDQVNLKFSYVPAYIIDIEEANIAKPTYFPTNDFMWPFQQITDTYGVPRYREINPTYFNVVTFPFLFGVMFGDIAHGFSIFLIGLFFVTKSDNYKKNPNNPLNIFVKLRYLLVLMGFFGFYCGWIYNDFLSLPVPYESCYNYDSHPKNGTIATFRKANCTYLFGIDPIWKVAKNELSFVNSVKMKLSVIIGVSHMLLGIFLKGLNDYHFQNKLGFFFEFIPQMIFLSMLFGYMDILIIIKWCTDWSKKSFSPPSIITQLLNIFLKFGSVVIY